MELKNVVGHFKTITKHKLVVFKLSIIAGIPLRGFFHDLSKYSPTEFWESAKYYQGGKRSPIPAARNDKGYSEAWLHHKGRNKHHFEYWYDSRAKELAIMPFKYSAEMICDMLAAGMTYEGKDWKVSSPLKYWDREEANMPANEKMKNFVRQVFTEISEKGVNDTISKKNLKKIYNKNIM